MLRRLPDGSSPVPHYLADEAFRIDLRDDSGTLLASADGQLVFEVPQPGAPGAPAPLRGPGPKWTIDITNNSGRVAQLNAHLYFFGERPVLTRDIDLDFLNQKLDQLFNQVQPFKFAFANEPIEVTALPFPILSAWIRPPVLSTLLGRPGGSTSTFFQVLPTEAWSELHPKLAMSIDLGARVFTEGTSSLKTWITATIHEGSLALKVSVDFAPGGRIDLLNAIDAFVSGWAGELGLEIADIASIVSERPALTIDAFSLDAFLVLRPRGTTGSFEIIAKPHVRLSESGIPLLDSSQVTIAVNLMLKWALEDLVVSSYWVELRGAAIGLLTWLLGERHREVVRSDETLALLYAGDPEWMGVGPRAPVRGSTPLTPGNLLNINHIVVVMMENRSFDHMLGFLSLPTSGNSGRVGLGRADVDGLQGNESNPVDPAGHRQRVFSLADTSGLLGPSDPRMRTRGTRFEFDPGHSFDHTKVQRGDTWIERLFPLPDFYVDANEGFVFDFATRLPAGVDALEEQLLRGEIMGYQPKEHVPMYEFLATQFAVCDRWFASHPGHTWPNRYVTLTGQLAPGPDGRPQLDNPDFGTYDPLEVETIFDHLSAAGVTWNYYEDDFCMLRVFSRYTLDTENVRPIADFYQAAQSGQLPSVAFIDPNLTDIPPGNDDHPPSDISDGQNFIRDVYSAVANGPQWPQTLFIITYDEHGGFFDHVHPPRKHSGFAPLADDPSAGRPIDYYGMRVPALIVSPWIAAGDVSSVEYDHTTIIKTIMARFLSQNPPYMGRRVALANDLGSLLSLTAARPAPGPVPGIRIQPDRRWVATMRPLQPPGDDFHAFIGAFRRRVRGR